MIINLHLFIYSMCIFSVTFRIKLYFSADTDLFWYIYLSDNQYDEDEDEITPDLWQEACWIVIR